MKKCPYCAEEIKEEAVVCKHCGKDLNLSSPSTSINRNDYAKYIIITILVPIAGLIMGIYFMTREEKEKRKMGESILVWSILIMIAWSALWWIFAEPFFYPIAL